MTARLVTQGLRAFDLDVKLDRLVLLTGDPGSGKSTAEDALRFLALGHVPAIGKTEAATADLMRGDEMSVRLEWTDGRWCERTLARVGRGLKGGAVASWLSPEANPSEHGAEITRLFGADVESAREHLDLTDLMRASAAHRAGRLEALLDATATPPAEAVERAVILATTRVAAYKGAVPEEDLPRAAALADGLRAGLSSEQLAGLAEAAGGLEAVIAEHGIAGGISAAKRRKSDADADAKQLRAAARELEAQRQELPEVEGTLDELTRQRDALIAERTEIAERKRAHERAAAPLATAKREAEQAAERARKAAEESLKAPAIQEAKREAQAEALALVAEDDEAGEIEAFVPTELDAAVAERAEEMRAEAVVLQATPMPRATVLTAPTLSLPEWGEGTDAAARVEALEELLRRERGGRVHRIGARLDDLRLRLCAVVNVPVDLARELDDLVRECRGDAISTEEKLAAARTEAEAQAARRQAFDREVARLKAEHETKLAEISERQRQLAEAYSAAAEDALAKRRKATDLVNEAARIEQAEARRVAALDADRRKAHDDLVAAARQRRERMAELRATIERADRDLDRMAQEAAAAAAAVLAADERLDELSASIGSIDEEAIAARLTEIADDVKVLDDRIETLGKLDAAERQAGEILGRISRSLALSTACAAVEWALQRLRERDLQKRTGPIVERIGRFLEGARFDDVEPYIRSERGALDFGWIVEGRVVPLAAMSGGETVVFMAAAAAAIVSLRAPEIPVLLIEAAEVGRRWLDLLLAGCAEVAEPFGIAHVLVATCNGPTDAADVPAPWQLLAFSSR